ncbi:Druantia anti-phage system protein DruA [Rheinheimera oceanensis]|uniref:Druantia anti-phage system protein DruA n=1 Tax=Rheinheimera oceanensis TaxID=2817449 RepID=UPI001BFEE571|nr:Druantia anti-phage system protein DruA [Rheinheimera oceanensis]
MDEKIAVYRLLKVRDPWASLILSGHKTWEVRGNKVPESCFGTVGITKSGIKGESLIYGVIDIVRCSGPLTLQELAAGFKFHRDEEDTKKLPYKNTYSWILKNPRLLKKPVKYCNKPGTIIWVKSEHLFSAEDFVKESSYRTLIPPSLSDRKKFLESLIEDLSFFGIELEILNAGKDGLLSYKDIDGDKESAEQKRKLNNGFRQLQAKNREFNAEKLIEIEKELHNKKLLSNQPMPLENLNLVIEPVSTEFEKDIHFYVRQHQNIPSHRSIGKTCDAIIYHEDSDGKHVVGILGVGSTAYSSGVRDNLFGWPLSNSSEKSAKDKKDKALKSIVQLNCIAASPPYNLLGDIRLTKLFALSVFSDVIVNHYKKTRRAPLLAAISSAGFGEHAHLFDRTSLNSLLRSVKQKNPIFGSLHPILIENDRNQSDAHSHWFNPSFNNGSRRNSKHWIFQREAITKDSPVLMVSEESMDIAKALCNGSTSFKKMNSAKAALNRAFSFCGISTSIFPTVNRGIYIGLLRNDYISKLVQGNIDDNETPASIPWNDLFEWWKNSELKRLQ